LVGQTKIRVSFDIRDAILTINPFLLYCSKNDRKLITEDSSKPIKFTDFTLQNSSKRNAVAAALNDLLIVRVLFSAGGFPDSLKPEIAVWNAHNPNCPVILMEATPELFGPTLSQLLHNLVGGVVTRVDGVSLVGDYLPLKKFPKQ